jgi:EAL and modified HD-GYP domain-containing signal transduction protein
MGQGAEVLEGLGHRRPLVGRSGQVEGFELLLAPATEQRLAARGDSPSVLLHYSALLSAAGHIASGGRVALVRVPALLLARPQLAEAVAAATWLLTDDLAALPPAVLAGLRARDVRLGVAEAPPDAALRPDFVVLRASTGGIDTLLLAAQRWREVWPQGLLVALGLRQLEDVEHALRGGVALAGGQLGHSGQAVVPRPLGVGVMRICTLLSQLAQEADTAPLADTVRADAVLGYRLLRYANSPAVGLRTPVDTVEQAIAILGRRELTRWLQVMLMTAAASRPAQQALQQHTLMRARLLERLAERRGETEPGAFFTLGLLSTMEQLLQVPLAQVLSPLRLREEAQQALLQRSGPWAAQLVLLEALEHPDEGQAWAAAAVLDVGPELTDEVAAAWAWASEVDVST